MHPPSGPGSRGTYNLALLASCRGPLCGLAQHAQHTENYRPATEMHFTRMHSSHATHANRQVTWIH